MEVSSGTALLGVHERLELASSGTLTCRTMRKHSLATSITRPILHDYGEETAAASTSLLAVITATATIDVSADRTLGHGDVGVIFSLQSRLGRTSRAILVLKSLSESR
jgi:hypothetical protein